MKSLSFALFSGVLTIGIYFIFIFATLLLLPLLFLFETKESETPL